MRDALRLLRISLALCLPVASVLAATVSWNTGNGVWDTNALNWTSGAGSVRYTEGDNARFENLGGGSSATVTVTGAGVEPSSVAFSNAAKSYVLQGGGIGGEGGVSKEGTGTVTFAAGNTYEGPTVIRAGVLMVAADQALGSTAGGTAATNGGTLGLAGPLLYATAEPVTLSGTGARGVGALFNSSGTNVFAGDVSMAGDCIVGVQSNTLLTLAGVVSGNFTLNKAGFGTLVLAATNALRSTAITRGSLLVNGSVAGWGTTPASVLVNLGGTLGGTGILTSTVIVSGGGTLAPGSGANALTVNGSVFLQSNGVFRVNVAGGAPTNGVLDLQFGGVLDIQPGAVLDVDGALTGSNAYVIARHAGIRQGSFSGLPQHAQLPPPNDAWRVHYMDTSVYLGLNEGPLWYFRSFATNGPVDVSWRTAVEVDVTGFDLYRFDGTNWVLVNASPIPPLGPDGGSYRCVDAGATLGVTYGYRLVENLSGGYSNVYETFTRTPTEFLISSASRVASNAAEIRWQSRDESYAVERSTNLPAGFGPLTSSVPATPPENVFTDAFSTVPAFYRIRLTP